MDSTVQQLQAECSLQEEAHSSLHTLSQLSAQTEMHSMHTAHSAQQQQQQHTVWQPTVHSAQQQQHSPHSTDSPRVGAETARLAAHHVQRAVDLPSFELRG
jgi:hypothetical protein